ncbi:MAG: hypothetical protein AAF547_17470 [Actinomycetota bacterium]
MEGHGPGAVDRPDGTGRPRSIPPSWAPRRRPAPIDPAAPPVCSRCRLGPAASFAFSENVGFVFGFHEEPVGGVYCQFCALAIGRQAQDRSLRLGWLGPPAALVNLGVVAGNARSLQRASRLSPPDEPGSWTLDPGRPVVARLGFAISVTLTIVVAVLLVLGLS